MEFNRDSERPDDPGAGGDTALTPRLRVITVVGIMGDRTHAESRCPESEELTLTERVLMFLDRQAA